MIKKIRIRWNQKFRLMILRLNCWKERIRYWRPTYLLSRNLMKLHSNLIEKTIKTKRMSLLILTINFSKKLIDILIKSQCRWMRILRWRASSKHKNSYSYKWKKKCNHPKIRLPPTAIKIHTFTIKYTSYKSNISNIRTSIRDCLTNSKNKRIRSGRLRPE